MSLPLQAKVLAAVNGCFLSCTECTAGPLWDAKLRNCDSLVHWVPFSTLNMDASVRSNMYPRSDEEAAKRACEEGEHCLDMSPLFGIFVDSLRARFRPVPSKPNTELVRPQIRFSFFLGGDAQRAATHEILK